jgi:hypothetical protein
VQLALAAALLAGLLLAAATLLSATLASGLLLLLAGLRLTARLPTLVRVRVLIFVTHGESLLIAGRSRTMTTDAK